MPLDLNKFYNIGTLTKAQVDENWDNIIAAFGDTNGLDQATVAQIRGLVALALVTPAGIGAALEWVSIPYASTIGVDGASFFQGEITLTGDAMIANPTNLIGTKYLYVTGSSATPRTLTFDSNYVGRTQPITDITNTNSYLISLVYKEAGKIITAYQGAS